MLKVYFIKICCVPKYNTFMYTRYMQPEVGIQKREIQTFWEEKGIEKLITVNTVI